MTDPLDQIARICAEAPEDALSRIADVLGFKEQQAEPSKFAVSKEWLAKRLERADDADCAAGQSKPKRPCDTPPGCNATNCLSCGEQRAEPVGDERAAFEAQASEWGWDLRREANDPNEYLLASTAAAWGGWQARAAQSGQRAGVALLADEHKGMRVDYQGLFKQARAGLRREPFLAEMLRQFQDHVTELGRRWYAGDTAVVDELLQLYCVEREARAAIAVTSANLEGQSNG